SRHVGIAFRSSRHEATLNLYGVENGRARLIAAPDLFREVTSRDIIDADGLRARNSIVEWLGGDRFRLRQSLAFVVSGDHLVKLLGAYGSVAEKLDDGKLYIEFLANAECVLLRGDRVRVVGLKPGRHGDGDTWWDQ